MGREYLKNPKTGVVFPKTAVLSKRPDLVPCDEKGRLVLPDQPGIEEHELLLNPANGMVVKWSEELAGVRGLIGVDNDAQAIATMEQLERVAASTSSIAREPNPDAPATESGGADAEPSGEHTQPDNQPDASGPGLELPGDAENWDSMQLKAWAKENLDEVLDGRLSPQALRDQIQVAINNHNQDAA